MEVTHFSSSDPRYQHDARSVKNWKCTLCGSEKSSFTTGAPFCDTCNKYMAANGGVSDDKVREIKNRTVKKIETLGTEQKKKGRKARYKDDLIVKGMAAVIKPRKGSEVLKLAVNMNESAFEKGLIMVEWGDVAFISSVDEFGKAFTPFDPTPKTYMQDGLNGFEEKKFIPKPIVVTTKIGSIQVRGSADERSFTEGIVKFMHDSQESWYSMFDIAQILKYAL